MPNDKKNVKSTSNAKRAAKAAKRKAKRQEKRALGKSVPAAMGRQSVFEQAKYMPALTTNVRTKIASAMEDGNKLFSLMDPAQRNECLNALRQMLVSRGNHHPFPRAVPVDISPLPIVMVRDVPYFYDSTAVGNGDPRVGLCGFEIFPSCRIPVWQWEVRGSGTVDYLVEANRQSAYEGLWPTDGSEFDDYTLRQDLIVDATARNLVGVRQEQPSDDVGSLMRKFKANSDNWCYGSPVEIAGTGFNVTFTFSPNRGQFPIGTNFEARLVSKTGSTNWAAGTPLAAVASTFSFSAPFASAQSDLGGRYAACLPDAGLAIQIRSQTGTYSLNSVTAAYTLNASARACGMYPMQLDYADSLDWVREASFVGLQPWIQYVGSDLQNAGQVTSIACPGGIPPSLDGYAGYNSVASTPGAFTGPLKTGTYAVWRPFTLDDIGFSKKDDLEASYLKSSVVWWGKVGTPEQQDALKLYLLGMVEATTRDPTRPLKRCRANPLAESLILGLLASYPCATENPLHMSDIKAFLGRVVSLAKDGVQFYRENKSWINPAATAAMTALAAL